MRLRTLEPGDAAQICALFSRHTPYRRDAAFWSWLNRSFPVRPSIVAVAECAGEIVGHYGILPLELRGPNGAHWLAGHGLHAFVSPAHRDRVSIFQISALAYRLAREAGLEFVFGFPNASYRLVQEKIERWRCVALFKAWSRAADTGGGGPASGALVPADFDDDTQLHDALALWETAEEAATGIRPVGWARWWLVRYIGHPQRPYLLHWYVCGGLRRGLVVAKIFSADGRLRAHLIDCALADGVDQSDVLRAFAAAFRGRAEHFVHWPVEPAFVAALATEGYREDGFETYFGMRTLRTGAPALGAEDPRLNPTAWRLPMGFSDAF